MKNPKGLSIFHMVDFFQISLPHKGTFVIERKKSRFLYQDAENDVRLPEKWFRTNIRCVCVSVCVSVCVCVSNESEKLITCDPKTD